MVLFSNATRQVTIVDANDKIFSSYDWPDKARRDVMNKLTHLGIKFVFNERIVFAEDDDRELVKKRTVQLASGATLESDVQIITVRDLESIHVADMLYRLAR